MKLITTEKEITDWLNELQLILMDRSFDINRDLYMILSIKTKSTLLDLDYDTYDVVEILKGLTVREYSHTLLDKGDNNPPLLFVFGKQINGRCVYIKIKIKGDNNKKVLCLSFHYAEWEMYFPYV